MKREVCTISRIISRNETVKERLSIVFADTDADYISQLHMLMLTELPYVADFHAITDEAYFCNFFSRHHAIDLLVVKEEFYSTELLKQDIKEIYILTETKKTDWEAQEEYTFTGLVTRLYRYSACEAIFREIIRYSRLGLQMAGPGLLGCRIVAVYSPKGGVGKTVLALALAENLSSRGNGVLYIDVEGIQTFDYYLQGGQTIDPGMTPQGMLDHICTKGFSYLPPFQTSIVNANADADLFFKLAMDAQRSDRFSFLVIDMDCAYDKRKAQLLELADHVVIVSDQSEASELAVAVFRDNICWMPKYHFAYVNTADGLDLDDIPEDGRYFPGDIHISYINNIRHNWRTELARDKGIQELACIIDPYSYSSF